MNLFCNVNRTGKLQSGSGRFTGKISFDPNAFNHYSFAILMSAAGDVLSVDDAIQKLSAQMMDTQPSDPVFALLVMQAADVITPTFRVCNLSCVYALSDIVYDETAGGVPRFTLLMQMIELPGAGVWMSDNDSYPSMYRCNATYLPPTDMGGHEVIFRPSYDLKCSFFQEAEPIRPKSWELVSTQVPGADQSVPGKVRIPGYNTNNMYEITTEYEALLGRQFFLQLDNEMSSVVSGRITSFVDDTHDADLSCIAHFHSPVAVVNIDGANHFVWLAWYKPADSMRIVPKLFRAGEESVVHESFAKAGIITLGPVRFSNP